MCDGCVSPIIITGRAKNPNDILPTYIISNASVTLASSCGEIVELNFVVLRHSIMPRQRAEREERIPEVIAKVRRPALNIRREEMRTIMTLMPETITLVE
jgi:hypothetical protein